MKILLSFMAKLIRWHISIFTVCSAGILLAQSSPDIVWSTNAHAGAVTRLAFSSDSAWLISGSIDHTAKVWRIADRLLLRQFSIQGWVRALAISPDQTLVALGDDVGHRSVWRMSDGTTVWNQTLPNHSVQAASFSPDSSTLAWGGSGQIGKGITVVESSTGTGLPFSNPERGVFDVRFSPDGAVLASANEDNTASLFRMPEGTLIRDLSGHGNRVTSVDFSSDGQLLATCAWDGSARIWRVQDGSALRTLDIGLLYGRNVRFSVDGKVLLSCFEGTSGQRAVQFWRISDGKLLLGYTNINAGAIAVSPDGKYFAYGAAGAFETNYAIVIAHMPLLITNASVRTNALLFEWQGGSGIYQIEHATDLTNNVWETVAGPTNGTAFTIPVTNSSGFFRVQSIEDTP